MSFENNLLKVMFLSFQIKLIGSVYKNTYLRIFKKIHLKIDGLNLVLTGTGWRNQAKAAIVGKILLKHDKLRQV